MSKHTAGPWNIVEDRVPASLEVFGGGAAITELWRRADIEKEKAGAHLISAAPELLEALELLLENTDTPPDSNCSCHICPPCSDCVDHSSLRDAIGTSKAAIAKARGEQV